MTAYRETPPQEDEITKLRRLTQKAVQDEARQAIESAADQCRWSAASGKYYRDFARNDEVGRALVARGFVVWVGKRTMRVSWEKDVEYRRIPWWRRLLFWGKK